MSRGTVALRIEGAARALLLVLGAVGALGALCVIFALGACRRTPSIDEDLAAFPGGFDPTRFDAGVLPEVSDAARARPIRFRIPRFYDTTGDAEAERALERYLEDSTGLDVALQAASSSSYLGIASGLEHGDMDVAELSPYQFALAIRREPGLVPLVASVARGASSYASYIVVPRTSSVRAISELRNRRVAFVDPMSTSGYVVPALFLQDNGLDLARDIDVVFAGSHRAALAAVREGRADAAAVSSDLLVGVTGPGGSFVVLAKAGRMPYDVIVARAGLEPAVIARLRAALLRLSIHDDVGRRALRSFSSVDGFMPVPDHHYDEVLKLAERAASLVVPAAERLVPGQDAAAPSAAAAGVVDAGPSGAGPSGAGPAP